MSLTVAAPGSKAKVFGAVRFQIVRCNFRVTRNQSFASLHVASPGSKAEVLGATRFNVSGILGSRVTKISLGCLSTGAAVGSFYFLDARCLICLPRANGRK